MGLDVLRVVLEDLPVQVDGLGLIAAQGQFDRMFASVFASCVRYDDGGDVAPIL